MIRSCEAQHDYSINYVHVRVAYKMKPFLKAPDRDSISF